MDSLAGLMEQVPIDQIASKLGLSEEDARNAVGSALPALLGGMAANAEDPDGAASLSNAIARHNDSLLDQGVNVSQIDQADGEKIVHNVFGANEDAVVQKLGGVGGVGGGTMAKLLPLLAPIVMSFLAKNAGSQTGSETGGIGDMLGGLLGGGASAPSGGGGLGDMLGGLLGGKGKSSAPDLEGLLGGLLGGGKKG